MKSIKATEVQTNDAIAVSHRRRVVTDIDVSQSRVRIEIGDAGSIFLEPNENVIRFEDFENLYCDRCAQQTAHSNGICGDCSGEWQEPRSTSISVKRTPSGSPQSPPPSMSTDPRNVWPRSRPHREPTNVASGVLSLIGSLSAMGGLILIGLAVWLWHLTDTGRYPGLDAMIGASARNSGSTPVNEFHVIAGGLGICGFLFVGVGIGLLATLWSAERSN